MAENNMKDINTEMAEAMNKQKDAMVKMYIGEEINKEEFAQGIKTTNEEMLEEMLEGTKKQIENVKAEKDFFIRMALIEQIKNGTHHVTDLALKNLLILRNALSLPEEIVPRFFKKQTSENKYTYAFYANEQVERAIKEIMNGQVPQQMTKPSTPQAGIEFG